MRIREVIANLRTLIVKQFLLVSTKRKTEKSLENMDTDVRVLRVN